MEVVVVESGVDERAFLFFISLRLVGVDNGVHNGNSAAFMHLRCGKDNGVGSEGTFCDCFQVSFVSFLVFAEQRAILVRGSSRVFPAKDLVQVVPVFDEAGQLVAFTFHDNLSVATRAIREVVLGGDVDGAAISTARGSFEAEAKAGARESVLDCFSMLFKDIVEESVVFRPRCLFVF